MDPIEGSQDFGERRAQACSYQAVITQDFFFFWPEKVPGWIL